MSETNQSYTVQVIKLMTCIQLCFYVQIKICLNKNSFVLHFFYILGCNSPEEIEILKIKTLALIVYHDLLFK